MKMREDIKARWLSALRSGKYKQGRDVLHNKTTDTFCCLGVLCDLAAQDGIVDEKQVNSASDESGFTWTDYDGSIYYLPRVVSRWAGLDGRADWSNPKILGTPVAKLNDSGLTFVEIANEIEIHL